MTKARFSDSTIIKTLQVNDRNFDPSVGALVALKIAGVSQPVIEAMLAEGGAK